MLSFHHIMSLLDPQELHRKYKVHQQSAAEREQAERQLHDLLQQKEYYCAEIRCEAEKSGAFEVVIEGLVESAFNAGFPDMSERIKTLTEKVNNAASQNYIY